MRQIVKKKSNLVDVDVITSIDEVDKGDYIKLFNVYESEIDSKNHSYGLVVFRNEDICLIKWAKSTKYFILINHMLKDKSTNIQIIEPQEFTAQVI